MHDVASISALHHFRFGQSIHCSDGEAGLLTQLVFDSASRRVISLGVLLGRVFGRSVSVPFATVVPATGEGCVRTENTRVNQKWFDSPPPISPYQAPKTRA